jgi:phosphoglycolate phosphatase-like HAD superfamily hydrolase
MADDQLPSWQPGAAKTAILEFVRSVTEPGDSFVPPDRIATFDNDGTLWCEKPMYPQADFLLRRWTEMARADPSLAQQQPWKAVIEDDRQWLASMLDHVPELIKAVTEAYDGITVEAFAAAVREFFDTARHPALGVPHTEIAFRPMRELITLLEASGFEVYICSAGGRDFVRVISQEMYGIAPQRVIGSGTTLEYRDGAVYRTQGWNSRPMRAGQAHPDLDTHRARAAAGRGQRRRRRRDAGNRAVRPADPPRRRRPRVRLRHGRRESTRRSERPRLDRRQHQGRPQAGVLTEDSY